MRLDKTLVACCLLYPLRSCAYLKMSTRHIHQKPEAQDTRYEKVAATSGKRILGYRTCSAEAEVLTDNSTLRKSNYLVGYLQVARQFCPS